MLTVYDYYRSSASYRVRIALKYKGLDCTLTHINLAEGEHLLDDFSEVNPQKLVPFMCDDNGVRLNQSQAIIEYLEEKHPEKPLLFGDITQRSLIRAFSAEIACDIHPLNHLRVLKYLQNELSVEHTTKMKWYFEWLTKGFTSLEDKVSDGPYCFGEQFSMADCFLIPQIYNAYRFDFEMAKFPKLSAIYKHSLQQDFIIKASPEERIKKLS